MKVKHDFTEVVNTFIAHGEDGVNRKKEMEELIGGFLQTVQESISKHFTKSFTCSSEPAPQSVDDHSFFSIVKGGARSENKFEVYIKEKREGRLPRGFKLFSYEYDSVRGVPVTIRYNEGAVVCDDQEKVIRALSNMLSERAVAMVEWCLSAG